MENLNSAQMGFSHHRQWLYSNHHRASLFFYCHLIQPGNFLHKFPHFEPFVCNCKIKSECPSKTCCELAPSTSNTILYYFNVLLFKAEMSFLTSFPLHNTISSFFFSFKFYFSLKGPLRIPFFSTNPFPSLPISSARRYYTFLGLVALNVFSSCFISLVKL